MSDDRFDDLLAIMPPASIDFFIIPVPILKVNSFAGCSGGLRVKATSVMRNAVSAPLPAAPAARCCLFNCSAGIAEELRLEVLLRQQAGAGKMARFFFVFVLDEQPST